MLDIPVGGTYQISVAAGVGHVVGFSSEGGTLKADGPHCLKKGDPVLLCELPAACISLVAGQCVTIADVKDDDEFFLDPALPPKTNGRLTKAADLRGFNLVMRIGHRPTSRYLNYGAVCKGKSEVIITGCHNVQVGDRITLGSSVVEAEITQKIAGTDGSQDYTIVAIKGTAKSAVTMDEHQFAVLHSRPQAEYHGTVGNCGMMAIVIPPQETLRFHSGEIQPVTISLERGWDMRTFNKFHGLNCPWKPDWSNVLYQDVAAFR